jgi:hypothetical protein
VISLKVAKVCFVSWFQSIVDWSYGKAACHSDEYHVLMVARKLRQEEEETGIPQPTSRHGPKDLRPPTWSRLLMFAHLQVVPLLEQAFNMWAFTGHSK